MDVLTALYWLSLNCYHEARSEPPLGQAYVSKTVMNRAEKSGKSIKAVILSPKQFSWVGTEIGQKPIKDMKSLQICTESAIAAASLDIDPDITHYHDKSVSPKWAKGNKPVVKLYNHYFYKKPKGEPLTMKKHSFTALSTKKCKCGRHIKQSIIDRKPTADKCYRCFTADEGRRGHHIIPGRKARLLKKERQPGGNIANLPTSDDIREARKNTRRIM